MQPTDVRLKPPFWRHDGYTLRRLEVAVRAAIARARGLSGLCNTPAVVVDLGAGAAPYEPLFASLGARYLRCDIAEGAPPPHIDVVLQPGHDSTLPAGSADWVVSFQVLEHVWDLDWYLGECRRLLRDDGLLMLSTHGTWLYHPHPTDFRRWTRDGLCEELRSRGFEICAVDSAVGPLAWTTQFRALGYHHVLRRLPVLGRFLSAAVCTVMNLRMHVEDAVTPAELRDCNAAVYLVLATPVRR